MASICVLDQFDVHRNEEFLKKAEALKPRLHEQITVPTAILRGEKKLGKNEKLLLDFGNHQVGYMTLKLSSAGSHQDAPAYIYLRFAERLDEFDTDLSAYDGWLGKGWIQEEYIHVDILPVVLELPRRYAFRYMEIRVIDVSLKYSLVVDGVSVRTVSAVKMEDAQAVDHGDERLDQIDRVSMRTLQNCMQLVFEDGPKRDRRMWVGDFRLQAMVNYLTFQNDDLVKRCLYLFGGLTFNEGRVAACLFTEPVPEPDDTYLFDYALLYVPTLLDYYEQTNDMETLRDLYPVAIRQIEIGLGFLDGEGMIPDGEDGPLCFIDWGEALNKQAAAMAVLIYSIHCGMKLAEYMADRDCKKRLLEEMEKLKESVIACFWDEEQQLFVSGREHQVSWATQVWMILAGVFPPEKNRELLLHTRDVNPEIRMVTPYMYHHYIDALFCSGEKALALEETEHYWGKMIDDGADTFWEVYDPGNRKASPYGAVAMNSFCHAWSCTPAYFLRKFCEK